MKLMIASDIHGSLYYCSKMAETYGKENASRLILLGDLLYHGPRNELPRDYNPKGVFELLNSMKDQLLAVRGNCDAEVDQMVLDFPIMADYATMELQGRLMFITHGHIYNNETPPKIGKNDILLHGHTHVATAEDTGNYIFLNPGSVSLPKDGSAGSYMLYEDGRFTIKDMDGEILHTLQI